MANKNQGPEVNSSTPLLQDFLSRPKAYAKVIKEMVQDGTLDPKEIEDSATLKECALRIHAKEAKKEAAKQQKVEKTKVKIDKAVTALKALSMLFNGEKRELIDILHQFAHNQDLEFTIVDPADTRIIGGQSLEPDENTVLFKNGEFAVRCFQTYNWNDNAYTIFIQPHEINEQGNWQEMVRPRS